MTTELQYLALSAIIPVLLWMPYILDAIAKNGLLDAVGYPEAGLRMSPWAERMKKAHYNAVENLVVFAVFVLIAHELEISNAATTSAATTYFWARLVHPIAYTLAIPWVRTLSFLVAWGSIICIAWQVMM